MAQRTPSNVRQDRSLCEGGLCEILRHRRPTRLGLSSPARRLGRVLSVPVYAKSRSLLFCFHAAALAQVAALGPAPVPVREEPWHRTVFENDHVRVLDVHVPPGGTTLYHVHVIPSAVVELSSSSIVSQEMGQPPPAPRKVIPGETRYAPYDEKPLTHRVTNQSPDVFHVLDTSSC